MGYLNCIILLYQKFMVLYLSIKILSYCYPVNFLINRFLSAAADRNDSQHSIYLRGVGWRGTAAH